MVEKHVLSSKRSLGRFESSLGVLSAKFMKLLSETENGILDLNHAATSLSAQKRRVYDITNVLEGIGLVSKLSKSKVALRRVDEDFVETMSGQHKEHKSLSRTVNIESSQTLPLASEDDASLHIETIRSFIRSVFTDSQLETGIFISQADIIEQHALSSDMLIAVRAPTGAALLLPSPFTQERSPPHYRLFLRSNENSSAGVEVFVLATDGSSD